MVVWRFDRRFSKDPDAMEPSSMGFTVMRVIGAIVFCVGAACLVSGITKL